ncbi:MAG: hypothetical protein O7G85_01140 [Planctomycetota bacterium]|nr:hypothetical protein [Planctomycetota bacterium]
MNQTANFSDEPAFSPMAAILAWLWPGLGHISLGERKRGFLIMGGVLVLVIGGLLIGGFDAVDRKDDRLWFYAQALCGPIAFGADYINQNHLKSKPEPDQLKTRGLGKVNEIGTLYIALGGLMNLIVILDALQFMPKRESEQPEAAQSDEEAS